MNNLVTGGCGYKGSVLISELLKNDHKIININEQWFGNKLKKHPNLDNIKLDIRDIKNIPLQNVEVIVHLANTANDPRSAARGALARLAAALQHRVAGRQPGRREGRVRCQAEGTGRRLQPDHDEALRPGRRGWHAGRHAWRRSAG